MDALGRGLKEIRICIARRIMHGCGEGRVVVRDKNVEKDNRRFKDSKEKWNVLTKERNETSCSRRNEVTPIVLLMYRQYISVVNHVY